VSRFQRTVSGQNGASKTSRSDSYQRREEPVLMPSEFSARLGPDSKGVQILLLHDDLASIVRAPFQGYHKYRVGVEPAEWTKPNFRREGWGKVPPVVAAPPVPQPSAESQDTKPKDMQTQTETVIQAAPQVQHEAHSASVHLALDVAGAALGLPPLVVTGLAEKMIGAGHAAAPVAAVIQTQTHQRSSDIAEDESEI